MQCFTDSIAIIVASGARRLAPGLDSILAQLAASTAEKAGVFEIDALFKALEMHVDQGNQEPDQGKLWDQLSMFWMYYPHKVCPPLLEFERAWFREERAAQE